MHPKNRNGGVPEMTLLTSPSCLGHAAVALALILMIGRPAAPFLAGMGLLAMVLVVWRHQSPRTFTRWVTAPTVGRWWTRRIRSGWEEIATRCELARDEVPSIRKVRRAWPRIQLIVRPVAGQTYADYERATEGLRLAVGASQLRVEPHGTSNVSMLFTIGDALANPFSASEKHESVRLDSVRMGRRSDGEPWTLPLGPHTLVAGTSGSGKGSLFWSFAFALAPAVRTGQVQLHGIDLKGGMEILMGEALFTTRATSATEAVISLEELVVLMQARTSTYAGHRRTHEPSTDEPLHVVMIDELAALTAYASNRELQRRAETAINLLCSQGRAPGFMVFACLQDPRKEVIPSRGLFTQMIGLRLKDLSETTMVLGEQAAASGAHCHRITRTMPGTGYVIPEDGGSPIRVRAGFASDDAIRRVAAEFPSPTHRILDTTEIDAELEMRQVRRSKSIAGNS